MKNITKESFSNEVIGAQKPVLVDLWAPWCGYCRMLEPILSKLAARDDIEIAKINIDEEPELGEQLQADTIPSLYLYQKGRHGGKLVAPTSLAQLESWIDGQLAKKS